MTIFPHTKLSTCEGIVRKAASSDEISHSTVNKNETTILLSLMLVHLLIIFNSSSIVETFMPFRVLSREIQLSC